MRDKFAEAPEKPVEAPRKPVQDHDWFVYLRWSEEHHGYPYSFAEPLAFLTKAEAIDQARTWLTTFPDREVDGPHKVYRTRNHG